MSTNGAAIHHSFRLLGSSSNSDVWHEQAYTAVLEIVVALVSASCRFNSSSDDTHTQGCQPLRQPKYLTVLSTIRWNNSFFGIIFLVLYPLKSISPQWSSYMRRLSEDEKAEDCGGLYSLAFLGGV